MTTVRICWKALGSGRPIPARAPASTSRPVIKRGFTGTSGFRDLWFTSGPPPVCGRKGRRRPRRAGSGRRSSTPSSSRPDAQTVGGACGAANLLEQLLLELAEARAQPARGETWWLDRALDALAQEARLPSDYNALAQELGMGLSTLRRRFKAATGLALHQYALQSRMASARTLLGETDLPIKAVAERLGYDNVYFFSRQFRQHLHVTPGAYRKSRQT